MGLPPLGLTPAAEVVLAAAAVRALGAVLGALSTWWRRRLLRATTTRLRVVVTGSSRGLGAALAARFLEAGDHVVISGRDPVALAALADALRANFTRHGGRLTTHTCDVTDAAQVDALASFACKSLGGIDVWVNNAGVSQGERAPLDETPPAVLAAVLNTNVLGVLLGTAAAVRAMRRQASGGAVFNVDGAGAGGWGTPFSAVYGVTKAALPQLSRSAGGELAGTGVGVHTVSPGMVITDLLLRKRGATAALDRGAAAGGGGRTGLATAPHLTRGTRRLFNILAERPDTVAAWLVPRMRGIAAEGMLRVRRARLALPAADEGRGAAWDAAAGPPPPVGFGVGGTYVQYLTPVGVVWRFATFLFRLNRFVDERGGA
jgi:chlorophyll(ide) b reductase